jgi:hypothetical protein
VKEEQRNSMAQVTPMRRQRSRRIKLMRANFGAENQKKDSGHD